MIRFDEATHTYMDGDGVILPSVTQILAPLTCLDDIPKAVLERKARLGTAVHSATELFDLDDLDESCLHPEVAPYLDGWKRFREDTGFAPALIERRVHHRSLGYAGTLDRIGTMGTTAVLIDIKTSATLYPSYGPQLWAYQEALKCDPNYTGPTELQKHCLQLTPDGKYKLSPQYNDPADWRVFVALLTVRNWRMKHGLSS